MIRVRRVKKVEPQGAVEGPCWIGDRMKHPIPGEEGVAKAPPPLFSVVMPCYNMAKKGIERAIESVQAQKWRDWELVFVDDGSTDGSSTIAARYAAKDARIRVHRQHNRGLPAARNAGYHLARGEYVAHLDPDDEYLPDKLALQARALSKRPYAGFSFGKVHYADTGKESYNWGWQRIDSAWEAVSERCLPPCQSVVVRRSLLQLVGGNDVEHPILRSKAQDWEQWTRCCAVTDAAILPEVLYRLHYHQDSQTATAQREGLWEEANTIVKARADMLGLARARASKRKTRLLVLNHEAFSRGAQMVMYLLIKHLPPGEFDVICALHYPTGELLEPLRDVCHVEKFSPSLLEWADVVHDHSSRITCNSAGSWSPDPSKTIVTDHSAAWRYPGDALVAQVWRNEPPALGSDLPLAFSPRALEILNPMELPKVSAKREDPPMVLGLLPAQRIKGIDVWLDAAERIHSARPDIRFVIAGVRPWLDHKWNETEKRLEELRALGVQIEALEPQSRDEVARLCHSAAVVLHLSRSESACVAVLEAQACGTPVVASNVWGLPQHVHSGALVPSERPDLAAAEVLRILGHRVPAPARHRIAILHNPKRQAGAYAEVYRYIRLRGELRAIGHQEFV